MEDVIVESIQIMGHNVWYVPRESFDEGDMILGEYSKTAFNKAYMIEAYLSNVMEHGGQGDFFSKFGLEIRDNDSFIISLRSFKRIIPSTIRERPQEGDLVYVPVLHKMYEITFIEQELMFHSIGKRLPFVYELKCEAFRGSQEPINTGVEEVDQVGIDSNYTMKIQLGIPVDNIYLDYSVGEKLYQSYDGTYANSYSSGVLTMWNSANAEVQIYNIIGEFQTSEPLIGQISQAQYYVTGIDGVTNYAKYDMKDNESLFTGADPILDFTETNPFGNP